MPRKFLALLLFLGISLPLLVTATASASRPSVVFRASDADKNGYFQITMSVYNTDFNAFQFALNFDPAAMQPVNPDGTDAVKFKDFAKKADGTDWMSTLGTSLDTTRGLIQFSGYVTPAFSSSHVQNGHATAGSSGLDIYIFYFKLLDAEKAWLKLATKESGLAYDPAVPDGGGLAANGSKLDIRVTFDLSALTGGSNPPINEPTKPNGGEQDTPSIPSNEGSEDEEYTPISLTPEQLLNQSIILQLNNHAAVVGGSVTAIYPGEKEVCAYLSEDERTMVPVRFVAERLGAIVEWENTTRTVIITLNGRTVRMPIGSKIYSINGQAREMDTSAIILHDRTMVPIRFVAEALGYQVEYDSLYKMAIISPYAWNMENANERSALNTAAGMLILYGQFV